MNHSLAILTVVLCFLFVQIAGAADKPNILFIMADDLRTHGGSYTKEVVRTPHLDRLASRGMTFELACAQYPVCNPSRTSLLTGLRCEQTGIVGNQEFFRERLPDVVTLPQLLRQSGWKTYSYGKILHTANTGENQRATWLDLGKSWDEAETTQPTASGAKGDIRNLTGGKLPWCEIGIIDGPEEEQPDALTATAAIHKIEELSTTGDPWMVAVGFHRPHDPFHAPRRYFDMYAKDRLQIYRDPEDLNAAPPLAISGAWVEAFSKFSEEDQRSFLQAYLAGVSFMDAQVGRLLETIDRLRLADNTIIVFLGDHGYHLGERQWWNKSTLFDRSCRAPFIIAIPNAITGVTFRGPVEFVDIYPTIADYCGLRAPHSLAGKSLRPVLEDPTLSHKEAAFTLVTRGQNRFGQSVRTERWRFTQWSDGSLELYDHDNDAEETRNIAMHPEHEGTIARLRKLIQALPQWPKPQ